MRDNFHNAVVEVASSLLVIPIVLGLVFTLVILAAPMITIAKIGAIFLSLGFLILLFTLGK